MNIVIRPYRETDRGPLAALTVAAFDGVSIDQNIDRLLGPAAARDWRWRKARQFETDIENGAEIAVAAATGTATGTGTLTESGTDRPVGYATYYFQREARIGWIHHLAVAAEFSGRGLGRRLLEHALARFRAEGMALAQIETLEQNAIGRHLFPSLGFREVARKIYYAQPLGGEPEDH
jgi:ribosomal protein S18 acetylase RimI-like enzyme